MKNEPPTTTQTAQNFQNIKEIDAHAKSRMDKVLSDLQHEMAGVRTGRASVSLLDNVRADYYGTPMPLNQMATLHVPDADHDHGAALGRFANRVHRESHPRRRTWG